MSPGQPSSREQAASQREALLDLFNSHPVAKGLLAQIVSQREKGKADDEIKRHFISRTEADTRASRTCLSLVASPSLLLCLQPVCGAAILARVAAHRATPAPWQPSWGTWPRKQGLGRALEKGGRPGDVREVTESAHCPRARSEPDYLDCR